jgi:hypothetical protein
MAEHLGSRGVPAGRIRDDLLDGLNLFGRMLRARLTPYKRPYKRKKKGPEIGSPHAPVAALNTIGKRSVRYRVRRGFRLCCRHVDCRIAAT